MKNKLYSFIFVIFYSTSIFFPTIESHNLDSSDESDIPIIIEFFTNYDNIESSKPSEQLYRLYSEQYTYSEEDGDFYYITMITELSDKVSARAEEVGVDNFPSVVFDGGYKKIEGEQINKNPYINAISESKIRDKFDLEIYLESTWTSSPCFPEIITNIQILNNENIDYNGRLIVYFAEIESDIENPTGKPYDFVFEDYAEDKQITIKSSQTDSYIQEIYYFPDSPGCLLFQAPNFIVVASLFSEETGLADYTTAARLVSGIQPYKPNRPIGENKIKPGETYTYITSSTDLDNDFIKYAWDWDGDFQADEYTDLYRQGEEIAISHTWESKGSYNVMVKAMDEDGFSSFWSEPLSISTSKNKSLNYFNPLILRLIQRFTFMKFLL